MSAPIMQFSIEHIIVIIIMTIVFGRSRGLVGSLCTLRHARAPLYNSFVSFFFLSFLFHTVCTHTTRRPSGATIATPATASLRHLTAKLLILVTLFFSTASCIPTKRADGDCVSPQGP